MGHFRSKRDQIQIKKKGLILCEGETERNYFRGLVSKDELKTGLTATNVEIYKPKNHSPVGLVEEAKKRIKEAKINKDKYDFVWIVFDKDGHQNIPDAFNRAKTNNPEIKIAFTVTCFEYFILLHFKKTTRPYSKCDDVISDLKDHYPNYEKATNIFKELEDKFNIGIENSKWCLEQKKNELLDGQPFELSSYSNIHELIEFIISIGKGEKVGNEVESNVENTIV